MQIEGLALADILHSDDDTSIWRGVRSSDGARVIVKCATSATPPPLIVARLRHELRTLERLRDVPGVVALLEGRETPRGTALVLRDDGLTPLSERTMRGPLGAAAATRIAAGIARALAQVHGREVIHKDVKPANVLVSEDGARVALIDFGIASWLGREPAPVSGREAVEGTLAYISPEQTGRTGRAVDARADLYALGVTLFELIAGRRPFDDADPLALMHAHLAHTAPSLDAVSDTPATVARLVARLLEKDPDARYQSAAGVAADLERCADALERDGAMMPFTLGAHDFTTRVRPPDALVGRDAEQAALREAHARARAGGREVVLLAGPSGSGKTVLARTVRGLAVEDGGVFLAGKHEALARSRPYASLAQAFGEHFAAIAGAPVERVQDFGRRVREALGSNAGLLGDLVRELAWVTGPLEPVAELGPQEQQNRLALAWRNLTRAVRDHAGGGLVLFLDDLQWADPATLGVLGDLLGDVERTLAILSFRVDETGPEHPLWPALERAASLGVRVTRVDVRDLDREGVTELVRASLPGAREVDDLVEVVHQRTRGNPFYVGQLLLALAARGRVARDATTGLWRWDVRSLDELPLGDGVVALVTTRLSELPALTSRALGIAACVGARFELATLAQLIGVGVGEAASGLLPALQLGAVVAEDERFRAALDGGEQGEVWLRFAHDRLHEAASAVLDVDARAHTHLRLARRLAEAGARGAARFELARHGIEALPILEDPGERSRVLASCLEAATAARRAGAFDAMDRFAEGAQAALAGAEVDAATRVTVAVLRVQCDVLMRRFASAEAQATRLLSGDLLLSARLGLHALRMQVAITNGALAAGALVAREALAEVGVVAPEGEALLAAVVAQMGRVAAIDPTPYAALDAWESESDEVAALTAQITLQGALLAVLGTEMLTGTYWLTHALESLLRTRRAAPASPMMLVGLGQLIASSSVDYPLAIRWVRIGAALAERMRSPVQADCAVQACHLLPHEESVERTVAAYERAIALGFELGAFQAISWGTTGAIVYGHAWRGEALATLRVRVEQAREVVVRAGDIPGKGIADLVEAWIDALARGPAGEPHEGHDVMAIGPRAFVALGNANAAAISRAYECHARWVYGFHADALVCAEEAEAVRATMFALVTVTDVDLWLGLGSARAADTLEGEARAARRALLERSRDRFTRYAAGSRDNFGHKLLLLEAEVAWLDGRPADALGKLDAAGELAARAGFVFIRALALERAGEVARALGLAQAARGYLAAARDLYLELGAVALAGAVARRHGLEPARAAESERDPTTTTAATIRLSSDDLDLRTVLRAAEALGAERDPHGVVRTLMQMVVASGGAERGVLLIAREDGWEVGARHGSELGDVGARVALDAVEQASRTALRFVMRSHQRLVVPRAAGDLRFADDPRVTSGAAASLVAAPLLHRGDLVGLLYLEHSAPGAFAPGRAALLEMLAGLGAVAWENARLVSGLQSARDALAEANAGLERQVAARTAELDRALAELWTEMDLATRIQTVLLPDDGRRGAYEVAARMRPAARVGGDYYDVFEHAGRLWVLVGDVSGHGVNAGLVMMMVQASVRAVVRALDGESPLSPAHLLVVVNAALREGLARIGRGQYMTITALRLDEGGAVHAGLHQDLIVRRGATGAVERIPSNGLWLGVVDDLAGLVEDTPLPLAPGDAITLFSDGVTESRMGRELLDVEPLVEAVARCGDAHPASVVDALLELLEGRVVDDDVTVLCLRHV